MADDVRRAARQPLFEVREVLEGDPAVDLGLRFECADYLDAVDFACEYLEENDPLRKGEVSALEIVQVLGDERETVWTYSYSRARRLRKDLVEVWGFDVTKPWRGPGDTR